MNFLSALFGQQPQNRLAQPLPANMPSGLDAIQRLLAGEIDAAASQGDPGTVLRNLGNGMIEKTNAYGNRQIVPMASMGAKAPVPSTDAAPQEFPPENLHVFPPPPPQRASIQQQPQQAAPARRGGGIGDAIANFFDPERSARNHTVGWLQRQGLDEGTATLVAGNKHLLQNFLVDRMKGADPMAGLEAEYKQMQIDKMRQDMEIARNPTTDDIREYQFAVKQGYEGTLPEFMTEMKRAGATTVDARNMGNIPPGYRVEYDENGNPVQMLPIPGGPEDTSKKDERAAGQADVATRVVTSAASRAREAARNRQFGGYGQGVVQMMPWTDSAEVARQVDVLKSTAKVENLSAMRAASPTGGALGSVTEKEADMLAAKSGALDPSSPTFERDLDDYELTLLQVVHGPEEGSRIFQQSRQGTDKPVTEMTDEELEALINGQ